MTLDPATADYLRTLADLSAIPYEDMATPAEARDAFREVARARAGDRPPSGPACSTEQYQIDGLWYRAYRPLHRSVHEGPIPLVVYLHGGGWVIGDLDTHDVAARAFVGVPANVLSVDYRLAPEHPYPAAHDDAWQAVRYAAEELGGAFHSDRLVVAGDSAGGLLAAAMAVRCRDEGIDLAAQCLVYPAMEPEMGSASHDALAEGYGLTRRTMQWFYDSVAPGPGFSPTELADLSRLAPAVVVTAEYDLLADDGRRYGEALRTAGVPTTSLHVAGLIHGFFGMGGISSAAQGAVEATVGALRGILSTSG